VMLVSAGVLIIQPSEAVSATGSEAAYQGGGDAMRGEQVYVRCIGCHSLDRDRTGPRHCGLFGRKAGTIEGYQYSRAMSESTIVWDRHSLDEFIQAPLRLVPGTTMGFSGVKHKQDRYDLLAYLKQASISEVCRRQD